MDNSKRHQRIPTRNHTGWTSNELNELSALFVEFCAGVERPVLDIGAALGVATLEALAAGATVIANDLEGSHLAEIGRSAPPESARRLVLIPARFPRQLHFAAASLGAVHASNVFHFLTGVQLAQGMSSIAHWLTPGGKVFVQASTPWQRPFAGFVDTFEARLRAGEPWPGWMEDTREYSSHRRLSQIPPSIHLLDAGTLRAVAEGAGLRVERAWHYRRRDLPASLFLDGRECAGLIAVRPD